MTRLNTPSLFARCHTYDSNREQEIVAYGNYELPFGRNKQFGSNVSGWADQIIGGWQISPVVTYASGTPFTLTYQECSTAIPGNGAPCYPNGRGNNLKLHVQGLNTTNHNRLAFHGATTPLTQQSFNGLKFSS